MSLSEKSHRPPSNDDLPEFEDRSKPFLMKVGMIFFLGLALALAIKPAFHRLNKQRGMAAAEQAESLMNAGRTAESLAQLRTALELAPRVPSVVRVAAKVLSRQNDPRAMEFWQGLLRGPEASRDDRLRYIDFALAQGRTDLTGPELEAMLRINSRDAEARGLMLRHHLQRDDLSSALSLARTWFEENRADGQAQLVLGELLLRHPAEASRAEGRKLLFAVASSRGGSQDAAVNVLAGDPSLTRDEIELLLRLLDSRPAKSMGDQLRSADLQLRLEPGRRRDVVDRLVGAGRGANDRELLALATWMELKGDFEGMARALPMERVRTNGALLSIRLQALAAAGQAGQVEPVLADTSMPLSPFHRSLIRATLAARSTPRGPVGDQLRAALDAAGTDAAGLEYAAAHAGRLGDSESYLEAQARLMTIPGHGPAAAAEFFRVSDSLREAMAARELLRRVLARVPGNRVVEAELAYYDLLARQGVAEVRTRLAGFVNTEPQMTRYRFTLALAEWLLDKPASALAFLETEPIDWKQASPRWQALRAGILGANGQADGARTAARAIPQGELRAEELAWIRPWL